MLRAKPSVPVAYILDLIASLSVFAANILSIDTMLSVAVSVASVLVCYHFGLHITMATNFGILSTGVVFPISLSISQAFARREAALRRRTCPPRSARARHGVYHRQARSRAPSARGLGADEEETR